MNNLWRTVGQVGGRYVRPLGVAVLLGMPSMAWAYSVKVEVTMPKNSAGEKLTANMPASTKLSPCRDATKVDAITIKVTYDANNAKKVVDRDLYVILYNPENDPKYLLAINPVVFPGKGAFIAYGSMQDMDTFEVHDLLPYLPRERNFLGVNSFELFPGGVPIDNVLVGTWQFVAILADRISPRFSFDDPTSWDAWDVGTVMFGQPWVGKLPGKICR